MNKAVWIYFI